MKLLRFAAAAAVCASFTSGQDLNRLELDNDQDVLWLINAPFAGAPVANFNPTRDLYWTVFPADAVQRCDGTTDLMGHELITFDQDFVTGEALWAYTITAGTAGTDGTILPTFTGAGVFVPGTSTSGTIFGPPGGSCPPPGYVSGWIYTETFVNTGTGLATPLLDELTADGSTDWVFTHYFAAPGPFNSQDVTTPPNSCGGIGDATLQWGGSTDGQPAPSSTGGENQPDHTGLGNSLYGGFNIGGAGTFAPISDGNDDGANVSAFYAEPMLQVVFDADDPGDIFTVEASLGALRTPLQIFSAAAPNPGTTTVGVRMYDAAASTGGFDLLLAAANAVLAGPFIDTIGCIPFGSASLGLSVLPGSGFSESFGPLSFSAFTVLANGEVGAESAQLPVGTGPAWPGAEFAWQGWRFSALASDIVSDSNVFRNTFHFRDGL